jgi:hypothetical protein
MKQAFGWRSAFSAAIQASKTSGFSHRGTSAAEEAAEKLAFRATAPEGVID